MKMADRIFNFKRRLYLTTVVKNKFNISKTCIELGGSRGDFRKHLPLLKKELKRLAAQEKLLEPVLTFK